MGVFREHAGFAKNATDVILPVKIVRTVVLGEIDVKFESVVSTVALAEEFVRHDEIAAGQGMVGESTVPGAKDGDSVTVACRRIDRELFIVHVGFEDCAVAENNPRANDGWIGVVEMGGSVGPDIRYHVLSTSDRVGVLMVVVAKANLGGQSFVVKNVCRRDRG